MNNYLTLIGHVGENPQVKNFATSNNKLAKFSIAVKEFSSSNNTSKPMWIDVEAWNEVGDKVIATITKGREVAVMGRLATSSYTKNGKDGKTIEIIKPVMKLTSFYLCGSAPRKREEVSNDNQLANIS
jgi:single-strand DNA-binding protein